MSSGKLAIIMWLEMKRVASCPGSSVCRALVLQSVVGSNPTQGSSSLGRN